MARFSTISKDGQSVRFEGKPRYIGSYLKPSYIEFSEIASPTPIDWQVGDYIDYPRTGLRYKLYSIPQASKNAKKGSHGRAFTYSNVQLHAATKELEIALFRDLVDNDNNIHFSTSPDVATFEDVYGIARRIQACMNDLYPNRWVIRVADFDSVADAEILEKISEAKDFALSGGTCLDALSKIYELWQDIGWVHSYENGKDVITIGYANKRISENTTDSFVYGKGNGLTAIKKNQTNKDEFATRLYVYGSERNLPSRYYNNLNIRNAESVDIRNLMLPVSSWGKTNGLPDARLAYLENASAVSKYGIIPKTHYFDSDDAGADIYPSIERITIGQVRSILDSLGETKYIPSSEYSANERVDEIKESIYIPSDNGELKRGGNEYQISQNITLDLSSVTKNIPKVAGRFEILTNHIIYQSIVDADFHHGEVVFEPSLECSIPDAGFTSVSAKVTLGDVVSSEDDPHLSNKSMTIAAVLDQSTSTWGFAFEKIKAKYDKAVYDGGFPVNVFVSITVEKVATTNSQEISIRFSEGTAFLGIKEILEKTFILSLKQLGFDISERASLGEGKSISMRSGMCEGRTFVISESAYNQWNDSWLLTLKRQQDDTLGMLFPNKDFKIEQGDRFVLLDIAMPELYVHAAMDRLLAEGEKLLARASKIQSHYEPAVDAKVMIESGRTLREGMFMQIEDEDVVDNKIDYILIDTLSIYEDESAIPTYKVTLKERRKVTYKGTPSATSSTSTRSVEEDAELDLSDYARRADLDFLKSLWTIDEATGDLVTEKQVRVKNNIVADKQISAGGKADGSEGAGGTGGSGGVILLRDWADYNELEPQAVAAILGKDLHDRLTAIEKGGVTPDGYATIQYVENAIKDLIGGAPSAYDTLIEIANALQGNENSINTILSQIGNKANKADLEALEERVETNENNISTNDREIGNLRERVATAEQDIDNVESDLAKLSEKHDDFKTATNESIASLEQKDEEHDTAIAANASEIAGLKQVDKGILDRLEEAEKITKQFTYDESSQTVTTHKNIASTAQISAGGAATDMGTGGGDNTITGEYKMYIHEQGTPNELWTITHNLGKFPNVKVVDSTNELVYGDVKYMNVNVVTVSFGSAFSGKAYLD